MFQPFDLFPKFRIAFAFSLLCLGVQTTLADGLPKAEDGYAYYCAGEREDKFFESPNAIIILKLKQDKVRNDKKAMLWCSSDKVDTNFILDRFFKEGDRMIEGAVEFTAPIKVGGKEYLTKISTGAGEDFQQEGKLDRLKTSAKVCGVSPKPNEFGLFMKTYKSNWPCNKIPYTAFGFISDDDNNVVIDCFEKTGGRCSFTYFYRNWTFSSRRVPRELVPHWREFYNQVIEQIEDRVVIYAAPDGCFGPIDCSKISGVLNQ